MSCLLKHNITALTSDFVIYIQLCVTLNPTKLCPAGTTEYATACTIPRASQLRGSTVGGVFSFRGMLGNNPAVLERHNPGGLRPTLINTTITQGHQGSAPPPSRPTRLLTTARWPLTERARLLCSTPVVQVKPTAAAHGLIRSAQRTPLGSTPA